MKALLIVAQENYHPIEYAVPKKILEEAGVEVVVASKEVGQCVDKEGNTTEATVALREVSVDDYDAIVFVGGSGARNYQQDEEAHAVAKAAVEHDKVLAAICIAPTILAYASVLNGKKATVHTGDGVADSVLRDNGAEFVDEAVVVDGKIITANGPPAADDFGRKIVEVLKA